MMLGTLMIILILPLRIAMWSIPNSNEEQLNRLLLAEEVLWMLIAPCTWPFLLFFIK